MGNLIAQPAKKKVARPAQDEFDRYTEAFVYDKKFEWGSKKAARHVQRKAKTVIAKRKIAHPILLLQKLARNRSPKPPDSARSDRNRTRGSRFRRWTTKLLKKKRKKSPPARS